MRSRVRHIRRSDGGFTLIELLVTVVILGVLLAIAAPVYIGFANKAKKSTAESNLRAALPAVEAFHSDHGTYAPASMTLTALRSYDAGLSAGLIVLSGGASTYCISSTKDGTTVYQNGPGSAIVATACT